MIQKKDEPVHETQYPAARGVLTALTLTRLSTFASKTPAVAGVLLVGLHYTAFRDAIREDSRQTTPSRGVTQRKKFAVEANVESRVNASSITQISPLNASHF